MLKKIILDFAKAVCEETGGKTMEYSKIIRGGVSGIYETAARQKH